MRFDPIEGAGGFRLVGEGPTDGLTLDVFERALETALEEGGVHYRHTLTTTWADPLGLGLDDDVEIRLDVVPRGEDGPRWVPDGETVEVTRGTLSQLLSTAYLGVHHGYVDRGSGLWADAMDEAERKLDGEVTTRGVGGDTR